MTDQPRLSNRLAKAAADSYAPSIGTAWNNLVGIVEGSIPELQALEARLKASEAREERLTAALETVVEQLDRVPRSSGPALLVAKRALAEPQKAQ